MNIVSTLSGCIEHFWFHPMTSRGFGLMRVGFGLIAFIAFLWQWNDVAHYYSDDGLLPRDMMSSFLRGEWRFSVLDYVGDPTGVFCIYLLLLTCLALVTVGVFTTPSLIISVLLIFSFHERYPTLLAGGDTVLRHIAFFLVLSPCHRSFSLWSYKKRLGAWLQGRSDPRASIAVMPMWPYRLLLWQFAVIYTASVWTKLLGTLWHNGTALEIVLHHEHFLRFPVAMMAPLFPIGPFGTYFTLIGQLSWPLLIIAPVLTALLPPLRHVLKQAYLRRFALLSNGIVHLMIFLLMDVGIFSLILFAGYIGLMREEDFLALRRLFNRGRTKKIIVLYDGHCGLCVRSVFFLHVLDWLERLDPADFRMTTKRKKYAPKITLADLDRALHIRLPDGTYRTGFSAFRALAWHLPPLWIIAPFLYLPGMKIIGDLVYASVAAQRKTCTHKECHL